MTKRMMMPVATPILIVLLSTLLLASDGSEERGAEKECRSGAPLSMVEELSRQKREFVPYRRGAEVAKLVSGTLNEVLVRSGYDKQVRPEMGGPPVQVTINFDIKSMGPVDESTNSLSFDAYFRQFWYDKRLRFNTTGVSRLVLNWAFLKTLWVPDTFLINGKKSYLHEITVPNQFVRISPDGLVYYSQRLTIKAECKQNLRKFPLDSQTCPLMIGSYGYDATDIVYVWSDPPVEIDDSVQLAQFNLTRHTTDQAISTVMNRRTRMGIRNDSIAMAQFYFERQTGFYVLQIYTPLILIVICSWVTFWLIKTEKGGEVPARTALGANSVLSVVNIGFGAEDRPQVAYATAMDIFIVLCFFSVFLSLLEFALINFIDTLIMLRKRKEKEKEDREKQRTEKAKVLPLLVMSAVPVVDVAAALDVDAIRQVPEAKDPASVSEATPLTSETPVPKEGGSDDAKREEKDLQKDEEEEEENEETVKKKSKGGILRRINLMTKSVYDKTEAWIERNYGPITELYIYQNTTEVLWLIDDYARVVCPLLFTVMQVFYWVTYLYLYEDAADAIDIHQQAPTA